MSKRVAITGMGIISPLGDSPERVHAALCDGQSGLHAVEETAFAHPINRRIGHINFEPESYLPDKNLRPLDRTGQLVVSAAKLALHNSGWAAEKLKEQEVGLVLGTMFGSVHTISKFDRHALVQGPASASPMDFANTVINAAAGQTAIWHKLRGINSTISCGSTSGLAALGYATDLLRYGHQTAILAGGADEFCFESFNGFEQAGLLYELSNETECPAPFDAQRTGFTLSEASALLMLEEWESAVDRGAPILAEIRGYGSTYNPHPQQNGSGQETIGRAIQSSLADAGMRSAEIDCISAAANGGIEGDRDEALAIANLWNGLSSKLLVTAVKSMIGESLGSSGALQAIALVETMRTGLLPGIPNLRQLAPDLPSFNISRKGRAVQARCGLVSSVGLDGHASALVISRPPQSDESSTRRTLVNTT